MGNEPYLFQCVNCPGTVISNAAGSHAAGAAGAVVGGLLAGPIGALGGMSALGAKHQSGTCDRCGAVYDRKNLLLLDMKAASTKPAASATPLTVSDLKNLCIIIAAFTCAWILYLTCAMFSQVLFFVFVAILMVTVYFKRKWIKLSFVTNSFVLFVLFFGWLGSHHYDVEHLEADARAAADAKHKILVKENHDRRLAALQLHSKRSRENHERRVVWNAHHHNRMAAVTAPISVSQAAPSVIFSGRIETPDNLSESYYSRPQDYCTMINKFTASGRSDDGALESFDRPIRSGEFTNGTEVSIIKEMNLRCHRHDSISIKYALAKDYRGNAGWVMSEHVTSRN